jgi:hypothetical protein
MNPNFQLDAIAASTEDHSWSSKKAKAVVSSSDQWTCDSPPELSQLKHISNPVTEQYLSTLHGNEAEVRLPHTDETKEAQHDKRMELGLTGFLL